MKLWGSDKLNSICPICGQDISINLTQLMIWTKAKGYEACCLRHEFNGELARYIAECDNIKIKQCKYYKIGNGNKTPYCTAVKWTMPCECSGIERYCIHKNKRSDS